MSGADKVATAPPRAAATPAIAVPAAARVALWMAAAALGYAGSIALVKHLSAEIDVYVLLFWRYFLALLLFAP